MGNEGSEYQFTDTEKKQISYDVEQLIQPIKKTFEHTYPYFVFKKFFLLSKRNPSEDFQMVKGRFEFPSQSYEGLFFIPIYAFRMDEERRRRIQVLEKEIMRSIS
jgi:hypothetical protein